MTVQQAFDELAAMCMSPEAGETQYNECRRFFMAGVLWSITEQERQIDMDKDETGENAYKRMQAIRDECVAFGQEVKGGRK